MFLLTHLSAVFFFSSEGKYSNGNDNDHPSFARLCMKESFVWITINFFKKVSKLLDLIAKER